MTADIPEWGQLPPEIQAVLAKMAGLLSDMAASGMIEIAHEALLHHEVETGMAEIYQELDR